ncbi:MAG: HAMP domain-containing histidine kinase [Chloroflexi bacterium]|nr:HAMP domain-containing histidine kinase [Chloroflexota bacterium]
MLSVIAHEFRTPLTIIHASVETLDHYADRLTEEQKQQRYQTIRDIVWYLNDMVQEVSTVGIDDISPVLTLTLLDALAFVRQLVEDLGLIAESQPITMETIACEETEIVTWDKNLVRRILHNLLTKALKYSNKPVRFVLRCGADRISLQVSDQGPGLSDEDQQHLFEAFYRGKNSSELTHGAGLGLYVVQRAVQAMGGVLRVESVAAKGTNFIVELPRHVEPRTTG